MVNSAAKTHYMSSGRVSLSDLLGHHSRGDALRHCIPYYSGTSVNNKNTTIYKAPYHVRVIARVLHVCMMA